MNVTISNSILLNKHKADPSIFCLGQSTTFEKIPNAIVLEIFKFLDFSNLLQIRLVNKKWKELIHPSIQKMLIYHSKEGILYFKIECPSKFLSIKNWQIITFDFDKHIIYKNSRNINDSITENYEFKFDNVTKQTTIIGKKIITYSGTHQTEEGCFIRQAKGYKLHGQGIRIYNSHVRMEGIFEKGIFIFGKLIFPQEFYPQGEVLEGSFIQSQLEGKGSKYCFSSGNKYIGFFKQNKLNGQGEKNCSDGKKFIGEFVDDNLNGQGSVYCPERGIELIGKYKNNVLNGPGIVRWANGDEWRGHIKNNTPVGLGTFYSSAGGTINNTIVAFPVINNYKNTLSNIHKKGKNS